jgi:hypothetical protein
MKRTLLISVAIYAALLIVLAALIVFDMTKAPVFFPLDDTSATYTISKDGFYYLNYQGKRKDIIGNKTFIVDSTVSPDSLDTYMNRSVVVQGDYTTGDARCFATKCKNPKGGYAGLKIISIKLK